MQINLREMIIIVGIGTLVGTMVGGLVGCTISPKEAQAQAQENEGAPAIGNDKLFYSIYKFNGQDYVKDTNITLRDLFALAYAAGGNCPEPEYAYRLADRAIKARRQ